MALVKAHPDLAGKGGARPASSRPDFDQRAGQRRARPSERGRNSHTSTGSTTPIRQIGIPFIVCVRRHTKDSILRSSSADWRMAAPTNSKPALAEIFRIGRVASRQRVDASPRLALNRRLSTHVLDVHGGAPAGARADRINGSCRSKATAASSCAPSTNRDGRHRQAN